MSAETTPYPPRRGRRWAARLAVGSSIAATAVLLVPAGPQGVAVMMIGASGLAVALAGVWWFLSRRGPERWLALGLVPAGPVLVGAGYARRDLLGVAAVSAVLWVVAVLAGRAALAADRRPIEEHRVAPPTRPFLIMNLRSGGGKVVHHRLVERARDLGARVLAFDGSQPVDVTALARQAVTDGADLLGVAGGDGTQALVAGVAAEFDVPFLVIAAGTRNHFAADLGLDRRDPGRSLDALTDGVELRVDLGRVGGRPFVNNVSFGAYAELIRSPGYRDGKARTAIDLLPGLLTVRAGGPRLSARCGSWTTVDPQALLVSNNPYHSGDVTGLGRRARLDRGTLGVLAIRVDGTARAVELLRGRHASGVTSHTAQRIVVESDTERIPVGIDGEVAWVPTPVLCASRPGALRVLVPRTRPGRRDPIPLDWRRLGRLAMPGPCTPSRTAPSGEA